MTGTSTAELRALSLQELAEFEFPEIAYLVDGMIPLGTLGLLVAPPKTGKTLFANDLVACVASGEPFLGMATLQGPVVLVNAEESLGLVANRLWTRLGDDRESPIYVVPVDGSLPQTLRLDDPKLFQAFADLLAHLRPVLVVLDPLREFHNLPENDSDAMAPMMRPLRQLSHEKECTVLVLHHSSKNATDPSKAARGSSAITGSADFVIMLDGAGEEPAQ